MKSILIVYLIMLIFCGKAFAYTESQKDDCISRALSNPATKENSINAISNYCDCALKAIIDENKNRRDSGYLCALNYFNGVN